LFAFPKVSSRLSKAGREGGEERGLTRDDHCTVMSSKGLVLGKAVRQKRRLKEREKDVRRRLLTVVRQ